MHVGELLQKTSRNQKKYRKSEEKFGPLGMEESEE
jgi:hypothetical protein